MWFHNATFDLTAFLAPLGFTEYEITTKDTAGHQFIAGWFVIPWTGKRIHVGDTLLYERASLRAVGERLGFPKGEIPYDMAEVMTLGGNDPNAPKALRWVWYININTGKPMVYPLDEAIEYCKRDVEILEAYYRDQLKSKIAMTLAVLGFKTKVRNTTRSTQSRELLALYMDHANFEKDFRPYLDIETYKKAQSIGGFTCRNERIASYVCREGEVITSLDVNSMYPFIMSGPLPYKELMDQKPESGNFMTWLDIEFREVY